MSRKLKIILLAITSLIAICLAVIFQPGASDIVAPLPFYDFPENKLWAHKANTEEDAHNLLAEFNGIETDVHYWIRTDEYYAGHDSSNGTNLESYFKNIPGSLSHYYWIDLKNIDRKNISEAVKKMKQIISVYRLEGHLMVELSDAALLAPFAEAEISTCLGIPDLSYLLIPFFAKQKLRKKMEVDLKKYHFDAISANYKMLPFLKKYFGQYNIHLWTNELKTEDDKQIINDLSLEPSVKIILVDYKRNFLTEKKQFAK